MINVSQAKTEKATYINIVVPNEIEDVGEHLGPLLNFMLQKLWDNKHKDGVGRRDVNSLMGRLLGEVGEFFESYHEDLVDPNNEKELADIANFALLVYIALMKERKQ